MPYKWDQWAKRILYRSDLSGYLYHLTKGSGNEKAIDRLVQIIRERKINGSSTHSGFITGQKKAICFQDAPISGIVQNVNHEINFRQELGGKVRYTYLGIALPKTHIFRNGGRPVFYEKKEIAKSILPESEHWRIVDFDLSDLENIVDWTHEREWRLPEDEFHFDLSKAVILVPNQQHHKMLIERLTEDELKTITGIIQISPLLY